MQEASGRPRKHSSSTTPICEGSPRQIRVTHPFHPLFGQQFELVSMHRSGGGWRAYFSDANENLRSIAAAFTDLVAPDPFVVQSAGRSYFRVQELLELARLLVAVQDSGGQHV